MWFSISKETKMKQDKEFSQHDLKDVLFPLEYQVSSTKEKFANFEKRQFNGVREKTLIFCLNRAVDIGQGCHCAAKEDLLESTYILLRSLLELFILTYWISLSQKNASLYEQAGTKELIGNVAANLKAGHAKITSKSSGEDRTGEFLASPMMNEKNARLMPNKMAKEAGIEDIYTIFYGILSMVAHGFTYGLVKERQPGFVDALHAATSILRCMQVITSDMVVNRKIVASDDLRKILNIPSNNI